MILIADHGWPFLATLPVAGALGFLVGAVIGIPALRIRGLYLSLITLGLALAFPSIVKSDNFFGIDFAKVTGGSSGKVISSGKVTTTRGFHWNPPSWAPSGWTTNDWVFTSVFVIAIVLFVLTSNLIRSSVGRGLIAMRDNETGAAVSGVHPARYKVLAFATSALVTSIGGGCFALASTTIGPDTFGLQRSIEFIAGLVIGGVATILGPAIGGLLVEWLPYWAFEVNWPVLGKLQGPQAGVLYGVILVVIIFFLPGGIVHGLRQLRSKVLVFVPRLPEPQETFAPPSATGGPTAESDVRPDTAVANIQQSTRETRERYQ
jgi:branched-chain amino acid transport system permease protein